MSDVIKCIEKKSNQPVYIMKRNISNFKKDPVNSFTTINLRDGDWLLVKETPEAIKAQIDLR